MITLELRVLVTPTKIALLPLVYTFGSAQHKEGLCLQHLTLFKLFPGVEPVTDKPIATTQHYTFTKHIRFVDGFPEKIGGWESLTFDDSKTVNGCVRSIFSYKLNGLSRYLLGSNTKLYDIFGSELTNITPLDTSTIAIANSLDTFHGTLGSNPIDTVSGSATLTINDTGHKLVAGDTVTLSGATAINGVLL